MRIGGTSTDIRHLTFWCLLLTVLGFFALAKVMEVKENYTELHRKQADTNIKLIQTKKVVEEFYQEYTELKKEYNGHSH